MLATNFRQKKNNFKLRCPADIEKSRPTDYASLKLIAETFLVNGTEIPNTKQESYLTLKKTDQLLIQSDKAKYKPGNKVQFRIIALNQDLRGLKSTVSYEIKSPSHNMMAQGSVSKFKLGFLGKFAYFLPNFGKILTKFAQIWLNSSSQKIPDLMSYACTVVPMSNQKLSRVQLKRLVT